MNLFFVNLTILKAVECWQIIYVIYISTAIKLCYQMNGTTDFAVIYRKGILHNSNEDSAMSTAETLSFTY